VDLGQIKEVEMALFVQRPSLSNWLHRVLRLSTQPAANRIDAAVQRKTQVGSDWADDCSTTGSGPELPEGPINLAAYRDHLDWLENQQPTRKQRRRMG
jgi:hypothetical protein